MNDDFQEKFMSYDGISSKQHNHKLPSRRLPLRFALFCLILITLASSNIAAQRFAGLWRPGGDEKLFVDADWATFAKKSNELQKEGYYLQDIEVSLEKDTRRFSGIWAKSSVASRIEVNITWEKLQNLWRNYLDDNLRLIDLEVYSSGPATRFICIWGFSRGKQKIVVDAPWEDFKRQWKEFAADDYRLEDIEIYRSNNDIYYAGVWQQGKDNYRLQIDLDQKTFNEAYKQSKRDGMHLVDVESYLKNGKSYYAGVWRAGQEEQQLLEAPWDTFYKQWAQLSENGLQLSDIEPAGAERVVALPSQPVVTSAPVVAFQTNPATPKSQSATGNLDDPSPDDKTRKPIGAATPLPDAAKDVDREFVVLGDDGKLIVSGAVEKPQEKPKEEKGPGIGSRLKRFLPGISTPDSPAIQEPDPPATKPATTTPAGGGTTPAPVASVEKVQGEAQTGKASYYADKFQGRPTASGEPYDRNKYTAAHRTLKFGTRIRVTNIKNGKSVIVRVNDRGPFSPGRIVDLSYIASSEVDGIRAGIIDVKLEVLK